MFYLAKFGRSRSNGTSVIKEIRLKKMTPRLSPFKVTYTVIGTDMDRADTYGFLLTFHSNLSYRFGLTYRHGKCERYIRPIKSALDCTHAATVNDQSTQTRRCSGRDLIIILIVDKRDARVTSTINHFGLSHKLPNTY